MPSHLQKNLQKFRSEVSVVKNTIGSLEVVVHAL